MSPMLSALQGSLTVAMPSFQPATPPALALAEGNDPVTPAVGALPVSFAPTFVSFFAGAQPVEPQLPTAYVPTTDTPVVNTPVTRTTITAKAQPVTPEALLASLDQSARAVIGTTPKPVPPRQTAALANLAEALPSPSPASTRRPVGLSDTADDARDASATSDTGNADTDPTRGVCATTVASLNPVPIIPLYQAMLVVAPVQLPATLAKADSGAAPVATADVRTAVPANRQGIAFAPQTTPRLGAAAASAPPEMLQDPAPDSDQPVAAVLANRPDIASVLPSTPRTPAAAEAEPLATLQAPLSEISEVAQVPTGRVSITPVVQAARLPVIAALAKDLPLIAPQTAVADTVQTTQLDSAPSPVLVQPRDMPVASTQQPVPAIAIAAAPKAAVVDGVALKAVDNAKVDSLDAGPATILPTAVASPTAALSQVGALAGTVAPAHDIATVDRQLDLARGDAWLDTLARDIAASADGGGRLRFGLSPERLGKLDVEVARGEGGVSIHMKTHSEEARAVIASAQPRLVDELRAQGTRVVTADVSAQTGERSDTAPRQQVASLIEAAIETHMTPATVEASAPADGRYA